MPPSREYHPLLASFVTTATVAAAWPANATTTPSSSAAASAAAAVAAPTPAVAPAPAVAATATLATALVRWSAGHAARGRLRHAPSGHVRRALHGPGGHAATGLPPLRVGRGQPLPPKEELHALLGVHGGRLPATARAAAAAALTAAALAALTTAARARVLRPYG